MAVRFSKDGQKVYVANYLLNAIQVVDLAANKVEKTFDLGGAAEPSLARRGEAIFYDGERSLDQWYSCHSCHYEGHTNSVTVDTKNDGRFGNFKTVLSLRNIGNTGPYFWHGWQKDLDGALKGSMTDTMLARAPSEDDVQAMRAFLRRWSIRPIRIEQSTASSPKRPSAAKRSFAATRPAAPAAIPGRTSPMADPRSRHRRTRRRLPRLQSAVAAGRP